MSKSSFRNPNDTSKSLGGQSREIILASTLVLLRDIDGIAQVLMLRKNREISFGGMWVFPGGKVDEDDFDHSGNLEFAVRNTAVREAREEAGLRIDPGSLVWFSHWTPPNVALRKYATWFFAADANHLGEVQVDGNEIEDHAWIEPKAVLDLHQHGRMDLAPPTWVTLYTLSRQPSTANILESFRKRVPRIYETRFVKKPDGSRVAMWKGDAGYETGCIEADGPRHRLAKDSHWHSFEYSEGMY